MADLLIRASSNDAVLLRRVFGFDGHPRAAAVPNRIVVDAHTVARTDAISDIARRAGVPFLVDPQTYLLQDRQHDGDKWASLPFADPAIWTPGEALSPTKRDALIRESINHQVTHGATSIIAPYVHLEKATSGWIDVQAQLWLDTRRYLDKEGLALPVVAVLAPGWRLLHPIQGQKALASVFGALETLTPHEVALAASRVAAGVDPGSRLMDLVLMIERLKARYPLIAWQQGVLGEACISAGAIGYETGIGWREKCDLQNTMAQHRRPSQGFSRRAGVRSRDGVEHSGEDVGGIAEPPELVGTGDLYRQPMLPARGERDAGRRPCPCDHQPLQVGAGPHRDAPSGVAVEIPGREGRQGQGACGPDQPHECDMSRSDANRHSRHRRDPGSSASTSAGLPVPSSRLTVVRRERQNTSLGAGCPDTSAKAHASQCTSRPVTGVVRFEVQGRHVEQHQRRRAEPGVSGARGGLTGGQPLRGRGLQRGHLRLVVGRAEMLDRA